MTQHRAKRDSMHSIGRCLPVRDKVASFLQDVVEVQNCRGSRIQVEGD